MSLAEQVRARLGGELEVLPGGHSGLTYTVAGKYVVKAVPPGQKPLGRNDVLRQARVLRALEGSAVPVPRVITTDETWFAMEFADGEAIEPVLDEHTLPPHLCRTRMLEAARLLRLLHDAGPVPGEPAATAAGELERWSRTMHAVPAELRPGAGELLRLLAADVPADLPPVLVHGDFRLGNVLFDGERATAVVDWEIWSTGDPRTDLGWFLLFADHRNFPALGTPVPGLPTEAELLDCYGRALPEMAWFRSLGRMKMAAIMGHNLRRHREGKHHDPDQERLPPTIAAMISSAADLLRS
ncbi:phosphotransferase family protein [Amycolatopsis vancoresmycina]|uniref:Aminoglycoside phosphotransferase n=1 Tax=Amycolatopsis vancoresmycina DSM 44592 TaxID=1292037 RepID=R1FYZ0_9PSEU|nr:phosphotransferase family protein [Amycolatopsis vancoresmycina]EOD64538.1 aminoglycoside phosphotransferase [Amycolatopsis vancoresmycina DSM 44592]